MFLDYLVENHQSDLEAIIRGCDIYQHYSIAVDFGKLLEADPEHVDLILGKPVQTIESCNADVIKAQKLVINAKDLSGRNLVSTKENVHTRFFGLPCCPDMHRIIFPKNNDLGCFLNVSGTVVRLTQSRMLEYKRKYKCVKCQHTQTVEGDYEHRYVIKPPSKCDNPVKCRALTFAPVNELNRYNCKDYQELKMQEQVNRLSVGSIPGTLWVTLEDDLVDSCKPGDDVNICGVVRRRWRPSNINRMLEVELILHANYIEVCNSQKSSAVVSAPDVRKEFDDFWKKYDHNPLQGRDDILQTICPQVYGLYMVKLALLLTVITGSNHKTDQDEDPNSTFRLSKENEEKNESSVRGQCHLLLVGDPGTGKSQLLKAGAALSPRSVLTSGAGSTRAGLTCTALREEGEWQLEAGALVLSDGGVCCIDEIGQMKEHDRTSIHEAMEQQTISIAKAGIVCKLNTRVAVIAACNPKGHYSTDQPLSVNVSLGTPLLSRFDLIFILLDTKNLDWDKLVASYILFGDTSDENSSSNKWSIEKLQTYLSLIGPVQPKMNPVSKMILQAYYMSQRKKESRDPSRTTVRMLDSLIRLSQAHCRLMYRTKVLPVDAIVAVSLMDLSMRDYSLPDTIDALHSTFPVDPDIEYLKTARTLLLNLKLTSIWNAEIEVYSKILKIDEDTLQNQLNCHNRLTEQPGLIVNKDSNNDSHFDTSCEITSTFFKNDEFKNKTEISINDKYKCQKEVEVENQNDKNLKNIVIANTNNLKQDEFENKTKFLINDKIKCQKRVKFEDQNDKNLKNILSKPIAKTNKLKFSQESSDDDLDMILSLNIPDKNDLKKNKYDSIKEQEKDVSRKDGPREKNFLEEKIKGKRKRPSNIGNKAKKKRNLTNSSDKVFTEENALNYLPSVNDFYKNLNINFRHLLSDFEDSDEKDGKNIIIETNNINKVDLDNNENIDLDGKNTISESNSIDRVDLDKGKKIDSDRKVRINTISETISIENVDLDKGMNIDLDGNNTIPENNSIDRVDLDKGKKIDSDRKDGKNTISETISMEKVDLHKGNNDSDENNGKDIISKSINIEKPVLNKVKNIEVERLSGKISKMKRKFEFKSKQKSVPCEKADLLSREKSNGSFKDKELSEQEEMKVITVNLKSLENHEQKSLCERNNETEKNSDNIEVSKPFHESEVKVVKKIEINQVKISKSVSSNTALKLQQFKFSKEKNDLEKSLAVTAFDILDKTLVANEQPNANISAVLRSKSSSSSFSQISIFETDDNFDDLAL